MTFVNGLCPCCGDGVSAGRVEEHDMVYFRCCVICVVGLGRGHQETMVAEIRVAAFV